MGSNGVPEGEMLHRIFGSDDRDMELSREGTP